MPLTGAMIRSFPDCVKLIAEAGTGYNNIDLAAAKDKEIGVSNVPTYATEAMAHMTVTLVMALSCSLVPQAAALATGDRRYMTQCHLGGLPHFELTGKTMGLVGGLGTIGRRVAAMTAALGMRVVASSTSRSPGTREDGVEVLALDDLLAQADFVSVHCPLNERTRHLIDRRALGQMKRTAFLINTARGAIVDQEALVETLRHRDIAGAALDVFGEGSAPPPPLPDDDPLWTLDNVVLVRGAATQSMSRALSVRAHPPPSPSLTTPDAPHRLATAGVAAARGGHPGRGDRGLRARGAVQHRRGDRTTAAALTRFAFDADRRVPRNAGQTSN